MPNLPRTLSLARLRFTWMYLRGRTPWDTGISPPELLAAVEGPAALTPGRALDLGCGTGTNSFYLARHGWHVTGVDFAAPAISRARARLQRAGKLSGSARFLRGDVTALNTLALGEPFNLLFDLGCFHTLPADRRADYSAGVARYAAPGARYLLYGFLPAGAGARPLGVSLDDLRQLFTPAFTVEREVRGQDPHARASAWYWLRRNAT
ncbi:MAG TPA: class I SAM-dependent methyltransferase [Ktedonobacterales bacterium]|nr:class I SAM-dependent methyltransferase [Ktedonobacterales bacterium]